MDVYQRLRELGVSVETADELSPIISILPLKWQEAVYLRLAGYTTREVTSMCRMSHQTLVKITVYLRIAN
jgi:hypothetical protein